MYKRLVALTVLSSFSFTVEASLKSRIKNWLNKDKNERAHKVEENSCAVEKNLIPTPDQVDLQHEESFKNYLHVLNDRLHEDLRVYYSEHQISTAKQRIAFLSTAVFFSYERFYSNGVQCGWYWHGTYDRAMRFRFSQLVDYREYDRPVHRYEPWYEASSLLNEAIHCKYLKEARYKSRTECFASSLFGKYDEVVTHITKAAKESWDRGDYKEDTKKIGFRVSVAHAYYQLVLHSRVIFEKAYREALHHIPQELPDDHPLQNHEVWSKIIENLKQNNDERLMQYLHWILILDENMK